MGEYRKPIPMPSPETKRFWEGTKKHELWIQRCIDCGRFYFYPRDFCPHCFSFNTEWVKVSGRGKLYTYAINHRPAGAAFANDVPYITAIVELNEGEGVRMMTNLVGIEPDPDKIKVGMDVEVIFEDVNDEVALPKFKPVSS